MKRENTGKGLIHGVTMPLKIHHLLRCVDFFAMAAYVRVRFIPRKSRSLNLRHFERYRFSGLFAARSVLGFTLLAAAVGAAPAPPPAAGQEKQISLGEVVVTATRTPVALRHLPDSVTVITAEELEERGVTDLYQALDGYPSADIEHGGWLGQFSQMRLRGAKNADTAVLFNGVRLYDPTFPANDFGDLWSYLGVENVERIEVIRGPQSALYGSNAMAGAIQVFTPRGGGPTRAAVKGEYGRYETWKGTAELRGSAGPLGYALGARGVNTGGLYRDSEYRNGTLDANLNAAPFRRSARPWLRDLGVDLNLRYTDAFVNATEWDYLSSTALNDPGNQVRQDLWVTSLRFTGTALPWWDWSLILGYNSSRRAFLDEDDGVLGIRPDGTPVTDSFLNDLYRGKTWPVILQNDFRFRNLATLTIGADYYGEKGEFSSESAWGSGRFTEDVDTAAGYANLLLLLLDERLALSAGGRLDHHEEFGTHGTWKAGASLGLPLGFRLKGNLATGFRAPSLYNLFDPSYGNPDLNPEESTGGDVGIEQEILGGKARWEAVYFNTHYTERISFDFATSTYFNSGTANASGLELVTEVRPWSWLRVGANYTYTEGQENNEENLAMVSRHKAGLRARARWEDLTLGLSLQYTGRRPSYDQQTFSADHLRVDLTLGYDLTDTVRLFGRAENLLDADYQAVPGYRSPGLAVLAGVQLTAGAAK